MKKYWLVLKIAALLVFVYRGELIIRVIKHIFITLLFIVLWFAVLAREGQVSGFNRPGIVTYYVLVGFVEILYTSRSARVITSHINKGDLSNFLTKPINYWANVFAFVLGERVTIAAFSFFVVFLSMMFFPTYISFPASPLALLAFTAIFSLAWIFSFQINFLIGLLTFWTSDTSYIRIAINQIMGILGGRWIPLAVVAVPFLSVLNFLPFGYLFDFPLRIYTGQVSELVVLQGFLALLLWFSAITLLVLFLWRRGLQKYSSYGK